MTYIACSYHPVESKYEKTPREVLVHRTECIFGQRIFQHTATTPSDLLLHISPLYAIPP